MLHQLLRKRKLVLLLGWVITLPLFSQTTGKIVGKVVDAETNEAMPGVNIVVVGTTSGAATDLDGNYVIPNLAPGEYSLKFSFISYKTVTIQGIQVRPGKESKIDVALQPSVIEMSEVVVSAEALRTSEFSILSMQKNANMILDGMSADLITKNNSSDGTDVLKRMAGITISEGKYAFIRGVSDRYNTTMLNGASLPSTDPEKRSFAFDLFPANLLENMTAAKSATPDKPGDFSGGLIEMNTIDFPSSKIFTLSLSTSYDPQTTFRDFLTYQGGKTDFLGLDDGTRAMPSLINKTKVGRGTYNSDELREIGLSFKNNWQTHTVQAPLRGSMKLSYGNSHTFGSNVFGYIAGLNYSNQDAITDLQKANYTFDGPRYEFVGTDYANSVSLSGMANFSLRLGQNHKLSSKNIYNLNSDNETTVYEGPSYYFPDYRRTYSLTFVSRSLYSSQLKGSHRFPLFNGLTWDWNASYGKSERDEPDTRRYVYNRDLYDPEEDFRFLLDQSLSTRFFSRLDDIDRGFDTNFLIKLWRNPNLPDIKFGFLYNDKERDFEARTFGFWNVPGGDFRKEDALMRAPIEEIFQSENFGNRFIEIIEITKPADSYRSKQFINAGYLMTTFKIYSRLKVITGVRYEMSRQYMDSYTITNEPVRVRSLYRDWLPSVNLSYALSSKSNLRAAFAKTLARPEFREIAPFSYFDFLNYELVEGNPDLKRTLINNFDLRYEFYPSNVELMAISGFYKEFDDPIEQILLAASAFQPIRSYENADRAVTYGVEFELKKGFAFIDPRLAPLSFAGNLSLIHSEIDLAGEKAFQADKRPLQGQADFIANAGLYYEATDGKFTASAVYNKVGKRIHSVGFANLGDVIEMPRDQIDLSLTAKLIDGIKLKLAVKDLLNQDHRFIQRSPFGDKPAEISRKGRVFSAGLSYQF
ncbi:MAG: TonB-dependent receptor [candidate division KSB1 bacterium]|nr:TonB-dependent receptor [candidate division KSB1 bacterium]